MNGIIKIKDKTALVFGEDTRSFLTVIRSLAKAGMLVDVVCFDNTSPALTSKYINKAYLLNHRSMDINEWTSQVENILINNQYNIVIPCDERSLFPLMDIKIKSSINTIFAVPEKNILAPLFDKTETRKTAEICDIPVAKGEHLSLSQINFEELSSRFGLPLVLKPTQSYAEEALNKRQTVKIAHNEDDLIEFKQQTDKCLVESYFNGYGIGVSILADKGDVKAAFAHARVAEPETGGGSSYRKAIPLDPTMLYACQKYCLHLNYTGVAMFEFKYNPEDKDWILIEINARFWGSLPLAVFAGVDFPAMYAATLLGVKIPDKLTYNHKAYARSFTADIYAIKEEFDYTRARKGILKAFLHLTKRMFSFTRLCTGNDSIDSFDWQDKKPFKAEIVALFKDKITGLPFIKQNLQKQRIESFTKKIKSATAKNEAITEVLFVCYGNIMRSPFAEHLFKKKITQTTLSQLNVDSFGFHQIENRKSKSACIEMAKDWQIDLTQHRSKWIKQQRIIKKNSLVIIFDLNNEHILKSFYPDVLFISLADLIPANSGFYKEIEDPYGKSTDELKQCYQLIDQGLDSLIEILK